MTPDIRSIPESSDYGTSQERVKTITFSFLYHHRSQEDTSLPPDHKFFIIFIQDLLQTGISLKFYSIIAYQLK